MKWTTYVSYRLWQELKRISSLAETEIGEHIDKDSRIKGFSIEGMSAIRLFFKLLRTA